jgi:hypothetical protein
MGERQGESEALFLDYQDSAGQAHGLHHHEKADQERIPAERHIDEYPRIDAPQIVSGAQDLNVSNGIADGKRHSRPTFAVREQDISMVGIHHQSWASVKFGVS